MNCLLYQFVGNSKMFNEHYRYEIYEKGVAMWSSNPDIYEATRKFAHAFRNNEDLKSSFNCSCCSYFDRLSGWI